MSQGWITVFAGSTGEAELARSRLEASGIPVLIPDDTMRSLNPFEIGGLLMFDRQVQVPASALDAARARLLEVDSSAEPSPAETELPADFFEPETDPDAELLGRLTALSSRIRWGAVIVIGAPFVLWQFASYWQGVRDLGRKPPQHGLTLAAVAISVLLTFAVCAMIYLQPTAH